MGAASPSVGEHPLLNQGADLDPPGICVNRSFLQRGIQTEEGRTPAPRGDYLSAHPPPSPFHGGFGLMNINGVRKPAWFVYKYLHALRGNEVPTADGETFAASDGRRVEALVWDWVQPKQDVSDRPYYTKPHPAVAAAPVTLRFSNLRPGSYRLRIRRTGFHRNDPQSAWIGMGKPVTLSAAQVAKLQSLTRDIPERNALVQVPAGGGYSLTLPMRAQDVVLVTMERMQ